MPRSETSEPADPGFAVRRLLRAAREGSLATVMDGAPFASLVTPAVSCGGDLLMLVSSLSRHGKHLRQDGRCALLVGGEAPAANPQAAPRLTVTGTAEPVEDPELRDRWVRIHPYGALYAGFADFSLWRLRPEQAYFVAGFGRVRSLPGSALRPPFDMSADESRLREAANARHAGTLPALARIVALDADGLDLGPAPTMDPDGEALTRRIAFPSSVASPEAMEEAVATGLHAAA